MPIHFKDVDLTSEVSGLKSALIVPCIMCPAVTVAIRDRQPLMKLFRSLFKSAPLELYIKDLQTRLRAQGIKSDVFKSRLYNHWFLCMWSSGRRAKLQRRARNYEAIIVLGCDSASKTVIDAVGANGCKVIQAMEVGGLTNAKLNVRFPANITLENVQIVPLPQQAMGERPGNQSGTGITVS
jgi:hypothetical protein